VFPASTTTIRLESFVIVRMLGMLPIRAHEDGGASNEKAIIQKGRHDFRLSDSTAMGTTLKVPEFLAQCKPRPSRSARKQNQRRARHRLARTEASNRLTCDPLFRKSLQIYGAVSFRLVVQSNRPPAPRQLASKAQASDQAVLQGP